MRDELPSRMRLSSHLVTRWPLAPVLTGSGSLQRERQCERITRHSIAGPESPRRRQPEGVRGVNGPP